MTKGLYFLDSLQNYVFNFKQYRFIAEKKYSKKLIKNRL